MTEALDTFAGTKVSEIYKLATLDCKELFVLFSEETDKIKRMAEFLDTFGDTKVSMSRLIFKFSSNIDK